MRLEPRLAVVVRGVFGQLVGGALGTEVVCVRANSVVAVVRPRDDDGEKLPFCAGELRAPEHDRAVEIHRRAQRLHVQRHGLDDVEDLPRPIDGGVVFSLQGPGRLAFVDQPEIRHRAILPRFPASSCIPRAGMQ